MTSRISDFYAGRSVFITGGTGFMGKVLVEKLLSSCPDIDKIYLLVRAKRGEKPDVRIRNLLAGKLFEPLVKKHPAISRKVFLITGDLLEPNLGISMTDATILQENVSIVFHSAATVRFDEKLKVALSMNVLAVKKMIALCKTLPLLDSVVHVSTAYANCNKFDLLEEKVYDPPVKPDSLINATEWMDDSMIDLITPKLITPRPNTYTYTKAIAEYVIKEEASNLPISIVRPSIVGACWRSPIPGWVDNFNGPTGLFVAIGKGLLRIMLGDKYGTADIIPVDIAINTMIVSAWDNAVNKSDEMQIYNCTTGQLNKVTWGELGTFSSRAFLKNPVDGCIRIPYATLTKSPQWHSFNNWMCQTVPATCLDAWRRITGKSPMFMKIQERVEKSVSTLGYFTLNQWQFDTRNIMKLLDRIPEVDRSTFSFDVRDIDWPQYLETYCMGTKIYALKENISEMPKAKQALKRIKTFHRVVSGVALLLTCQFLVSGILPLANSLLNNEEHSIST